MTKHEPIASAKNRERLPPRSGHAGKSAAAKRGIAMTGLAALGLEYEKATDPAPARNNSAFGRSLETAMDTETFNLSIRKFLKMVGVNSQREIEQAVAKAVSARAIAGTETFAAKVTLEIAALKLNVTYDGEIRLQ